MSEGEEEEESKMGNSGGGVKRPRGRPPRRQK